MTEVDMGSLDEISQLLGRLQADTEASQKSRSLLHAKVDKLSQDLAVMSAHSDKMAADVVKISAELKAIDGRVQNLEYFKVRLLAFATFLGALGSFVGEKFSKVLSVV